MRIIIHAAAPGSKIGVWWDDDITIMPPATAKFFRSKKEAAREILRLLKSFPVNKRFQLIKGIIGLP
jgi:hypothetical protein